MPEYVALFRKAFPGQADPVTFDNMGNAIGAFERKLVTPSRWDKFLKGDQNALTAREKQGFNRFVETGCQTCHNGPFIGGKAFQKMGLAKPFPDTDQGRAAVTKQTGDEKVFKAPSLRNIEKTGPYFHNGSSATLEPRWICPSINWGRTSDGDISAIMAWLRPDGEIGRHQGTALPRLGKGPEADRVGLIVAAHGDPGGVACAPRSAARQSVA
jgi:hypothetical protein